MTQGVQRLQDCRIAGLQVAGLQVAGLQIVDYYYSDLVSWFKNFFEFTLQLELIKGQYLNSNDFKSININLINILLNQI